MFHIGAKRCHYGVAIGLDIGVVNSEKREVEKMM